MSGQQGISLWNALYSSIRWCIFEYVWDDLSPGRCGALTTDWQRPLDLADPPWSQLVAGVCRSASRRDGPESDAAFQCRRADVA